MNISKKTVTSVLIFAISPILSIFILFYNVYRKHIFSYYLLSLVVGVFSFIYIPYYSDDRVRHVERFIEITNLANIRDFYNYIIEQGLPDFLSYLIMFFVSRLTDNTGFFFLLTSAVTYFLFSFVFFNFLKNRNTSKRLFFYLFIAFFLSFDYVFLFSGMRFYLAASFFIYAWYTFFFTKKKGGALLMFVLAISTHFSIIAIVCPCLILYFCPKLNFKAIFIASLLFILIPSSTLFNWISYMPFSASYISKAHDYLMFSDIQLTAAKSATIFRYILFFKNIWIYVAIILLILTKNIRSISMNTLYLLFAVRSFFYSLPTITHYYDTILVFITLIVLTGLSFKLQNRALLHFFVLYFFVNFSLEIIKSRESFILSNINLKNLYSISLYSSTKTTYTRWRN